jgi:hypothetical protein
MRRFMQVVLHVLLNSRFLALVYATSLAPARECFQAVPSYFVKGMDLMRIAELNHIFAPATVACLATAPPTALRSHTTRGNLSC